MNQSITDDAWTRTVISSIAQPQTSPHGDALPRFPDAILQANTTGLSGEAAIRQAAAFHVGVRAAAREMHATGEATREDLRVDLRLDRKIRMTDPHEMHVAMACAHACCDIDEQVDALAQVGVPDAEHHLAVGRNAKRASQLMRY